MRSAKMILFVSHDASRTGATIMLLNILRWIKANTSFSFHILLNYTGPLENAFRAIAPVSVFHQHSPVPQNTGVRLLKRFGLLPDKQKQHLCNLKRKLLNENIGLVYVNTIANIEPLIWLEDLDSPVICHIHELEYAIRYCIGIKQFETLKRYTRNYIAVSESVKRNLMQQHQIPEANIEVIYECIPDNAQDKADIRQIRNQICQELHIPQEARIVCASGTTDWRKGADLFIQLARAVSGSYQDGSVHFIWVGGRSGGLNFSVLELQHDILCTGLEQQIHFVGEQTDPSRYFAACDIFTLMSREDPFPVVCLEAAAFAKPIVCFDRAGGMPEFVQDTAGYVVPYLDIATMAEKVLSLLHNPEQCQEAGRQAQRRVQEHHNVSVIAPKIITLIHKELGNNGSTQRS